MNAPAIAEDARNYLKGHGILEQVCFLLGKMAAYGEWDRRPEVKLGNGHVYCYPDIRDESGPLYTVPMYKFRPSNEGGVVVELEFA